MRLKQRRRLVDDGELVEHAVARIHPLRTLFLMDVIQDRDSRPVFLWAGSVLLVGTLAYHFLEGWSLLDSLYFSVITLATVGYGDLVPTTPVAKVLTILYVINGISILLALLDRIRVVRSRRLEQRRGQTTAEP
jgi:voltage-gated potassium channel Kch